MAARVLPESGSAPQLITDSPNTADAEAFVRECQPTLMLARCKMLLRERIFSIPALGTYALHPGICPEYRNAHGCFWAAALGDRENIGTTLLRIDAGWTPGPCSGTSGSSPSPANRT